MIADDFSIFTNVSPAADEADKSDALETSASEFYRAFEVKDVSMSWSNFSFLSFY